MTTITLTQKQIKYISDALNYSWDKISTDDNVVDFCDLSNYFTDINKNKLTDDEIDSLVNNPIDPPEEFKDEPEPEPEPLSLTKLKEFVINLYEYDRSAVNDWKENNGYKKVKDNNIIFDLVRKTNNYKWNANQFLIRYSNGYIPYKGMANDYKNSDEKMNPNLFEVKFKKYGKPKFMYEFLTNTCNYKLDIYDFVKCPSLI